MKKILALALACCSALITTQSVQARNPTKGSTTQQHHSGDSLAIGKFEVDCSPLFGKGSAEADTRNITVNEHSQQVVHLSAAGGSQATAFLNNDTSIIINTPISFNVVKGNGNYFGVILTYTPPHGGTPVDLTFVTSNTKLILDSSLPFIVDGHGNYTIPLGSGGIPQGAQLTFFQFIQEGKENDCSRHTTDFSHLQINRTFTGIAMDPAENCNLGCGDDNG